MILENLNRLQKGVQSLRRLDWRATLENYPV